MIEFRELDDNDPTLVHSPLLRAVEKTFSYLNEHGSIGLTPSTAFKRNFVHWAAAEFDWPGFTEKDLFRVNKVLNELDFMPVADVHALLLGLKIGRHYKGEFKLTKAGQTLVNQRGKLFGIITPAYLFHLDHSYHNRFDDAPFGNWDTFINVLNVEVEDGASGSEIRKAFYGERDPDDRFDRVLSGLYINVLRPLCWAGLLHEQNAENYFRTGESVFTKTPLWRTALRLDMDQYIKPATRH